MIPRVLSVAAPLFVFVSLAITLYGLYCERRRFDKLALAPAAAALLASFVLLPAEHRLFYDEDIYIHIASNLTRAPVAQLTLLGGPDEILASSYYKEPVGWPALLSLVFLWTGTSEGVAFVVARLMYALAIAAVYQLGREMLSSRARAMTAAIAFGAAPICFVFSVSTGTDLPAALFTTLGLWGLAAGNGPLAAGGLALAAQTRLELIALLPLWLVTRTISKDWKITAVVLLCAEFVHLQWVLSVAPVLAKAEHTQAAFSAAHVPANLLANLRYLLNPLMFPVVITVFALFALYRKRASLPFFVYACPIILFGVYLAFYAGSFNINPRYSIQLLAPLTVLAASAIRWPVLLITLVLPFIRPPQLMDYSLALAADHQTAVEFASGLGPTDLVVTTEPEIFFNRGIHAMNGVYAAERGEKLAEQLGRYDKVWYYAGVRTGVENSQEWAADRWVKSNCELHLIDSRVIRGMNISVYEILSKSIDRKASLRGSLKGQRNGSKLW